MMRATTFLLFALSAQTALAATIRVPEDHQAIQAAIDASRPGDTVLVGAGVYKERVRLRPGIALRSVGDDSRGETGLARAEATVIDGGRDGGDEPGVAMAEGSTLDGFTVTRVGLYDEAVWRKHWETRGEQLADEEGSVQAEGTVPAISVRGVNCAVANNIVHHNGDVGIAVMGAQDRRVTARVAGNVAYRNMGGGIGVADLAEPIVQHNVCHENLRAGIGCRGANPLIVDNLCFGNVRAGIGCREGAMPVVRGNRCHENRRAGIGIRMAGTSPVVEKNECYENGMAGIGSRDGATPLVRGNTCLKNKMAGIGIDGSRPLVVGNWCRENAMAGIGVRGGANVTILDNKCIENKLVAIGITENSTATIRDNRLERTGGMPPLIAVKDTSRALIQGNRFKGGGVAAVLVQGKATVDGNEFTGKGENQGTAVWAWKGSTAVVSDNTFDGYRSAVVAQGARVVITNNTVRKFRGPAIVVKESTAPAHVFGNRAVSDDSQAAVVEIEGPTGVVAENVVEEGDSAE